MDKSGLGKEVFVRKIVINCLRRSLWMCSAAIFLVSGKATAEQLVYPGIFTFVIPETMSTRMLEVAGRKQWINHGHTRWIDTDGDQRPEYVAIGLGAAGGYGAQVRYRLSFASQTSNPQLGRWFWCVLTDPGGARIYEAYNPVR
jgi:hypothetical protein